MLVSCLGDVSHIKVSLCLKQAHLVWLMRLFTTYGCVCLLKGLWKKLVTRQNTDETSLSAHFSLCYSQLTLKASSAQKLSVLLPVCVVCVCMRVCVVLTVPFIAHLAALLFYHCLAPLTSQRDNIRAFYRIIPLLKRKLFSWGARWPSISYVHTTFTF